MMMIFSRKYATTEKLAYLASDCVDHTIETIIEKEGDRPFVPFDYIYSMFLNILANSAFGKRLIIIVSICTKYENYQNTLINRYEIDDPEFKQIKYILRDYFTELNEKLYYLEFVPFYQKLMGKSWKNFTNKFDDMVDLFKNKYQG